MKSKKHPALACPFYNIGASAHLMVAFSDFYESHKPPPLGNGHNIVPPHCDGHRKVQQRGGYFALLFCLLLPWRPPRRYGASSHPMVAFSGFYKSPGPPPLVDVRSIPSAHRHGHQNGPWRRCIRSPLPYISIAVIVAKDHDMVLQIN
jgi:hypothetical protein